MFLLRSRVRYKALCCSVIDIMYHRNCPRDVKTWQEFQRLRSYWPHLFQIKSTFIFVYAHSKNRLTDCWTVRNNRRYLLTSFLHSKIRITFYCAMLSCHVLISRRFEFSGPRKVLPEPWTWERCNLSKRRNPFTPRRDVFPRRKESSATPLRKLQNLRNETTYEKQQPASSNKISTSKTGTQHVTTPTVSETFRSSWPIPLILISILTSHLCLCFIPFLFLGAFRKPVAKSDCELRHVRPSIWLQGINRRPPERIERKQIMDSY
jgi:hypothetical protein